MGGDTPRAIKELLEPKIDWREALREFISEFSVGKDEYTWRKFNRRMLPNDLYLPSTISETVGELVVAIDTSGSIGSVELAEFATELASICESVTPSGVRVLWWDTMVAGEQKFTEGEYQQLASMLKPKGGGGTRVSAVADYIKKKNINAEAVIVFTDGYVENDIKWDITTPTLWLVTQNKSLTVPSGHKKLMKED
jgi:predicted metal-dependent peptidase